MRYRQSALRFGLCALLLVSLSACTYLIPADPSSPRYNTVMGERHAPIANNAPVGPQDMVEHVRDFEGANDSTMEYEVTPMVNAVAMPAPAPTAPMPAAPVAMAAPAQAPVPMSAPVMPTASATAPTLIPIAPSAPVMPSAPVAMPMAQAPMAAMPPALPPVDLLTQTQAQREMSAASRRQTPYENYAAPSMNVARSDLNTVPPRPAMWGNTSPQSQLDGTRSELEQDRRATGAARDQLKRDAAAEPSLLPERGGAMPQPAPLPPVGTPQSNMMPMGLIPPPPPLMAQGTVQPGMLMPAPAGMNAPILLRPPNGRPAPMGAQQPATEPMPALAPAAPYYAASGDGFDPMSSAAAVGASIHSSAYSGSGFMPQARYKR